VVKRHPPFYDGVQDEAANATDVMPSFPSALGRTAVLRTSAIAILIGMFLRANEHFSDQARFPMLWGIDSSVSWTACTSHRRPRS